MMDIFLGRPDLVLHEVRFEPDSLNVAINGKRFTVSANLLVKPNLSDNDAGDFFDNG